MKFQLRTFQCIRFTYAFHSQVNFKTKYFTENYVFRLFSYFIAPFAVQFDEFNECQFEKRLTADHHVELDATDGHS